MSEQIPVARFYTAARNVKTLFGKLPGGTRIPFGPYTFPQLLAGVLVLILGYNTMTLWGPLFGSSSISRFVVLIAAAFGALWGAGQLPSTRRKAHFVALDAAAAVSAPASGTINGQRLKLRPPHTMKGTVLLWGSPHTPAVAHALGAPAVDRAAPRPAAPPVRTAPPIQLPDNVTVLRPKQRPTTGLDRLLEQAHRKED